MQNVQAQIKCGNGGFVHSADQRIINYSTSSSKKPGDLTPPSGRLSVSQFPRAIELWDHPDSMAKINKSVDTSTQAT